MTFNVNNTGYNQGGPPVPVGNRTQFPTQAFITTERGNPSSVVVVQQAPSLPARQIPGQRPQEERVIHVIPANIQPPAFNPNYVHAGHFADRGNIEVRQIPGTNATIVTTKTDNIRSRRFDPNGI